MKSLLKYLAAVALCVGLCMPDALAAGFEAVPHSINVQGVLRNVGGEVVTGTYSMKFMIYDAVSGGSILCQNITSITVTGGVFNTVVPCPETAFINRTNAYLGISVGTDAELARIPLTSVGFAIQAEHAEKADELLGPATNVECTGCIGASEVAFNYAASDRPGGPATEVNCSGCVSGGAPGDIAAGSITTNNIGAGQVQTGNLANDSVNNDILAENAVMTGSILDGQVTTPDLANGAVTTAKLGTNAVTEDKLGAPWARGTGPGGPAADLACTTNGCVSHDEAGFNYALGKTKGGDAAGLDCLASPCVDAGEVKFSWAAGAYAGGPATDVACTDCIGSGEVQFNYAASASENGPASNLACTGCVDDTDVFFNYAKSNSKGGDAIGLSCGTACVSPGEVDFNFAASNAKGGPANNVACVGCVDSEKIADGSITDYDVGGPINGSKISTASTTDLGVVKIGSGILITNGAITPDYGLVAQKGHTHASYFTNGSDNLQIGDGKYIEFLDPDDNPGSYAARFTETTASNNGGAGVTLSLGATAAYPDNSYLEITATTGLTGRKHFFSAGGNAYHAGNLQFDGTLTCAAAGCVNSAHIVNNTITSSDILNGTITGSDLASNLSLTTTGTVTADTVWAKKFVDKDEAGGNWFTDPYGTSVMNGIQFVDLLYKKNTSYGLKDNGTSVSLYASSIDAGAGGETLYIAKNVCGQIDVYGSACGANVMSVHGTLKAKALYDDDDNTYFVDPAAHTKIKTLETATSQLPATGTTTNYITGKTYAFDDIWYDNNANGYYVDPNNTSTFNVVIGTSFRTAAATLQDPSGGNGQLSGDGSSLFLIAPPNGAGDIYLRNQAANKLVFNLEGTVRTALPSIRTNGANLFINPAGAAAGDSNLYLNYDTGGANRLYGTTYANKLLDLGSETCQIDGGDTTGSGGTIAVGGAPTTTGVGTRQYQVYSYYHSANRSHITEGLRVSGNGIYIEANDKGDGYRDGIYVYNGRVAPRVDNTGTVGTSTHRWAYVWAVNPVLSSERSLKKNIRYLSDRDMSSIGAAIRQIKPATWLYNEEVGVDRASDKDFLNMRVRNVPHIGAVLDEMPDIITNGGEAWYANDSIGFLLVASKYLDDRITRQNLTIRDLEDRIAVMEQILVDAGLYY